jgi:hypothetical protein
MEAPKYKLARNGVQYAEVDLPEVAKMIAQKKCKLDDNYWKVGMEGWREVSEIAEAAVDAYSKRSFENNRVSATLTCYIVSALFFCAWLFSSAEGSAVRQQVLLQYFTNAILLAILGCLIDPRLKR